MSILADHAVNRIERLDELFDFQGRDVWLVGQKSLGGASPRYFGETAMRRWRVDGMIQTDGRGWKPLMRGERVEPRYEVYVRDGGAIGRNVSIFSTRIYNLACRSRNNPDPRAANFAVFLKEIDAERYRVAIALLFDHSNGIAAGNFLRVSEISSSIPGIAEQSQHDREPLLRVA